MATIPLYKQLRLDNWVETYIDRIFDTAENPTPQQRQITVQDLILLSKDLNIHKYRPIRIDQDWFDNFGFKWDFRTYEYLDGRHNGKLFVGNINGDWIIELKNGNNITSVKLEYVHQLQNIYFALFGEELELNATARPNTDKKLT